MPKRKAPPRIVIKGSRVTIPPGFVFKRRRRGVAIQHSSDRNVSVYVVCVCNSKGSCYPEIKGSRMTCKTSSGKGRCKGKCSAEVVVFKAPDIEVIWPGQDNQA